MSEMKKLKELYVDFSYPSAGKLVKIAKKKGLKVKTADVKAFVKRQAVDQIHKTKRLKPGYIVSTVPWKKYQGDLLDMSKFSNKNKGYKWVLMVVEIFTRYAWAVPLKTKRTSEVASALETVFKNQKPLSLTTDSGNEFTGAPAQKLYKKIGLQHITVDIGNHKSLGIIDRFTRTLRAKITRVQTAGKTTKWVDKLQKIVHAYNDSPHSGINDIEPNEADSGKNRVVIGTINEAKRLVNVENSINSIEVGDTVRILNKKGTFTKGTFAKWSAKMYEVERVTSAYVFLVGGLKKNKRNVMVVNGLDESIADFEPQQVAHKRNKVAKDLKKVDIKSSNIVTGKRSRGLSSAALRRIAAQ